jgi:hypothetical protein
MAGFEPAIEPSARCLCAICILRKRTRNEATDPQAVRIRLLWDGGLIRRWIHFGVNGGFGGGLLTFIHRTQQIQLMHQLSGNFFESELGNISPGLGVLHCHSADVASGVQVDDGIFVQIPRFDNFTGTKLNVESIGILKILNLHRSKPRSKNAL